MSLLRHLPGKFLVLLFTFLVTCDGRPSYYITAPSYIVPGKNTTLAVHWFGDTYSQITVSAGIMTSTHILVNVSKVFQHDRIGTITIPAIPQDPSITSYTLAVIGCGEGALLFSQRIKVKTQTNNTLMFIQTDKTTYRPGESVRIRVISVNHNLRPYNGVVNLIIKDPKNYIVQEWPNIMPVMGIVSKEFLLSDRLLLGDWKIEATSDGYEQSADFSVADYVSPKFDVILHIPTYYIESQIFNLTGTVKAWHASGTPIKGNVTVSVKPLHSLEGSNEVNKIYEISGSTNFSFTKVELLQVLNQEGMNVTVSVTDGLTGIIVNAESYILCEHSKYKLNIISQQPAFGPGLNFTAKIQVQRIDNKPLSNKERDQKITVNITQWRNRSDNSTTLLQHTIPESGIIDLAFPVLQSIQWITITAEYQNTSKMFSSDLVYTKNPFIDIQISKSPLKVGEEFNIQVTTHLKIKDIYYVVISKGLVVFTGRNSTNFSLIPEASWVPSAKLIVYWLNSSNNVNDIMQISKILSIKGTSNNKVSLSWSKNMALPSEHVFLSVNVKEPHSLVGLQVLDKSSVLRGNGNDLTTSKVYDELMSYYQFPPANMTDAVIQNKYEYIPRTTERTVLPPRKTDFLFPDIWIWQDTNISSSLTKNLDIAVPNRNTSWVAKAFVISENLGLGIAEESVEISVFKPFIMSLNMPYSVTRGESFVLEVILFSSLSENLQVLVSLERHDSFAITVPGIYKGSAVSQHSVTVPSQGRTRVLFPIRPKTLGNIPITVKATSNTAYEVLTKTVLVKAEGVTYIHSQTAMFELIGSGNAAEIISKDMSFIFPRNVVPGSKEAYLTVMGDFFGPSINGLESLIQMPSGCGEQNMISLAPNIYILQYLIGTNQITSDIKERAIHFMEKGYQRELTYRRRDGSFSAFGNSDSSGSTWLTAFIVRCFLQARTFIYINTEVLNETVEWLVQYQDMKTGIFSDPGRVTNAELQSRQNGPITLTAYILTSLLEDEYYRSLYASRVQKAVQYLEKKFDEGIDSDYTLSVVVYALSLANSYKAQEALILLNLRATTTEETQFWYSPSKASSYYWQPSATDIETAAYALLSHFHQGRIVDGIPIMKWLIQQRNHLGGFTSTQDTILALQAISKYFLLASTYETSLALTVTGSNPYMSKTFQINNKNLLVLQSQQIQASPLVQVNATAVGRGLAILELKVMYNRKPSSKRRLNARPEAFRLDVTVKEEANNIHRLSVDICMRFQGRGKESGMALLDVGYLSGFTLSPVGIARIKSLKLVEPKEENVYLYFDSVTKEGLCISIPMVRFAMVANSQDGVVKLTEYYNPEISTTRSYKSLNMQQISTSDYCGLNCTQYISDIPKLPLSSKATVPTFSRLWFFIILVIYFV